MHSVAAPAPSHSGRPLADVFAANAVKFTEEGSVELVVQSCEAANGGERIMLVFEVRDTGIGIPPAQIGELFSLFTQLDSSSTRRYEGSGLGTDARSARKHTHAHKRTHTQTHAATT